MSYLHIRDEFYDNLTSYLKTCFPEFDFDAEDGPYLIMDGFSRFMMENNSDEVNWRRCCKFLNEAISMGGDMTVTLIVLQVFHRLYYTRQNRERCREYLNKAALELFDRQYLDFLKRYKPDD